MSDETFDPLREQEQREQARAAAAARGPQSSLIRRAFTWCFLQLIALAVFIGFPALWTAMAPVSWITFERHDVRVVAHTTTCLLFVVPFKQQTVDPVVGIGEHVHRGEIHRQRRPGRDKQTRSEDEGFLEIHGPEGTAEVSVTPFNLKSVQERSVAFLNDPNAKELTLFVVANWKFSVLGGGLISLLTVLYVLAIVVGLFQKFVHVIQWARGVPPAQRLWANIKPAGK
jgi:hypothetical protein